MMSHRPQMLETISIENIVVGAIVPFVFITAAAQDMQTASNWIFDGVLALAETVDVGYSPADGSNSCSGL